MFGSVISVGYLSGECEKAIGDIVYKLVDVLMKG